MQSVIFKRQLWFLEQCKQKLYNCLMRVIMSVKIKMSLYLILNFERDLTANSVYKNLESKIVNFTAQIMYRGLKISV